MWPAPEAQFGDSTAVSGLLLFPAGFPLAATPETAVNFF
jgi:hypothetical protein